MANAKSSKVLELFGHSASKARPWIEIIENQWCPFTSTRCFKVRKSRPDISIGTCSVRYGKESRNIVICPKRLLERRQTFMDCLHLLTQHEPGNELHVVPEMSIPGGNVDYFLVSVKKTKVRDFVAIEFQTLDTTGTLWPERQRLLKSLGLRVGRKDTASKKSFGMNWKMTAKTVLVQLHHKVETLEHLNKRFALVIQDCLLAYLQAEFNLDHVRGVRDGDTMHIHSYKLTELDGDFRLDLDQRLSTDAKGVAECLGIQAETKVELEVITAELERKISPKTLLTIDSPLPPVETMPTE